MKLCLLLFFCGLSLTSKAQINQSLKKELDSLYVLDQKYRGYTSDIAENPTLADSLMTALNVKTDLTNTLWAYQNRIDSSNLVRVERVISTYGYPGITLVGKPTNEAAWYVIQHSPKIKHYFPLIQQAEQTDELPFYLVAMMQDRLMTEQRKPQLYGTQGACYPLRDTAIHEPECFIWPIAHPKAVNQRRKKAGFSTTVEENAKRLNVDYKVLTMKGVLKTYNLGDSK